MESTKVENATFPYKTARSEANVNSGRLGSVKWTYHKEQSYTKSYYTVY